MSFLHLFKRENGMQYNIAVTWYHIPSDSLVSKIQNFINIRKCQALKLKFSAFTAIGLLCMST